MSSRRSGRAKAPVKYTSDSEGSTFGARKRTKGANKATPKKRTRTEQDPATGDATATPKKRTKKDPEILAAEYSAKAQAQEEKAQKAQRKKVWEDWLEAYDVAGELLDDEPSREDSITQTDSLKKYGLKKEELGSLKHFEKKNPQYNNTIKLFLEDEVKKIAFRKYGMLDGVEGSDEEEKNGALEQSDTRAKEKTPKQKWAAYLKAHTLSEDDAFTAVEPKTVLNQSECKAEFGLMPSDLVVLTCCQRLNPMYGNYTKLFDKREAENLAYRKHAIIGRVEENDAKLLEKGKELFEEGR
ncbi:hypothetical protein GQ44DRAFT_802482 [Phaeosphaeriaceae sp. PMI808]|nr:hypothetical protein GQ44DRAFT_802482 [Phaeosphaeriaceae sp. PMI808]